MTQQNKADTINVQVYVSQYHEGCPIESNWVQIANMREVFGRLPNIPQEDRPVLRTALGLVKGVTPTPEARNIFGEIASRHVREARMTNQEGGSLMKLLGY